MHRFIQSSLNKKAVSDIIATVSLVLLALLAVSILGAVINKVVNSAQLSPQMSCLEMKTSPPIEITKACYNSSSPNKDLQVTLKRKISTSIFSLDFIVSSASESSRWAVGGTCADSILLESGQTETYLIGPVSIAENIKISLEVDNCLLETEIIRECWITIEGIINKLQNLLSRRYIT